MFEALFQTLGLEQGLKPIKKDRRRRKRRRRRKKKEERQRNPGLLELIFWCCSFYK